MSSKRVLTPFFYKGFPFPIPSAEAWDGETFVENGTITLSGVPYPFYTPPRNAVGPGTFYPIGMSRDTIAKVLLRVRSWDFHQVNERATDPPPDFDLILNAGGTLGTSELRDESELRFATGIQSYSEGAPGAFSCGLGFSAGIVPYPIGYSGTSSSFPDPVAGMPGIGIIEQDFISSDYIQKDESTGLYYPLISVGPFSTLDTAKGGSPAAVVSGDGTVVFDLSTTTFTVTGSASDGEPYDYTITISPRKYWEYNGTYDEDTGLPV